MMKSYFGLLILLLLIIAFETSAFPQNLSGKLEKVPKGTGPNFSEIKTDEVENQPNLTCLFMVDLQSLGIDRPAITTYQKFFNFGLLVASKLNDVSKFTGFMDTFGYNSGLNDHNTFPVYSYQNFKTIPFPIDDTNDDIDLDLKDLDRSLRKAHWVPAAMEHTCLILFSAAPESNYGGTVIQTTYHAFTTVIGVLVGEGTNSIPGLTDPVSATTLSDADAQAVVQKLLASL